MRLRQARVDHVRHRVDGLEASHESPKYPIPVRYRADGLKNKAADQPLGENDANNGY